MLPFKAKLTGDFLQSIKERADRWSSVGRICASIVVPDDMIWWYYNEYGTATKSDRSPGPAYDIVPLTAGALSFPGRDGVRVTVKSVVHPGIKPSHMVGRILEEIRTYLRQAVSEHLPPNFDPDLFREVLFSTVMPRVKELIKESFATQLTGVRPDGKTRRKIRRRSV